VVERRISRWGRCAVLVVSVIAVLILAGGAAVAAAKCKKVEGSFTLQPVSAPICTAPVGVCATGTYRRNLRGTSTFTGTSLTQTVDTPTTAVVLLTGDNLIHIAGGDLMTKDAIALNTIGTGDFGEVDTIVSGTGVRAGASGTIPVQGTFALATGGHGNYVGEICRP
jgi:hypothetical protein